MIEPLPLVSSLSPAVLSFLDTQLHTTVDLQEASRLVSELQNDCHVLDQSLTDLNQNLGTYLLAYSTHSDQVGLLFKDINIKLTSFQPSISGQFSMYIHIQCSINKINIFFFFFNNYFVVYLPGMCVQMERKGRKGKSQKLFWGKSCQLLLVKWLGLKQFESMLVSYSNALYSLYQYRNHNRKKSYTTSIFFFDHYVFQKQH